MDLEVPYPDAEGGPCEQQSQDEAGALPLLWVLSTVAGRLRWDVHEIHIRWDIVRDFAQPHAL